MSTQTNVEYSFVGETYYVEAAARFIWDHDGPCHTWEMATGRERGDYIALAHGALRAAHLVQTTPASDDLAAAMARAMQSLIAYHDNDTTGEPWEESWDAARKALEAWRDAARAVGGGNTDAH